MTWKPRFMSLIGMAALAIVSLGSTVAPAIAQTTTSITVENTTPACVDPVPTSMSFTLTPPTGGGVHENANFNTFNPNLLYPSVGIMGVNVRLYVNTCLDAAWNITGAITDFHSGTNTISSATHLGIQGGSGTIGAGMRRSQVGTPIVAGTTGIPSASPSFAFVPDGTNRSVPPQAIATGTAAANGQMISYLRLNFRTELPKTTPGGTYQATLTLTFASEGP